MKYLPVVTLDAAMYEALLNGQLRLQRGQWVRIPGDPPGHRSKPSRFVSSHRTFLNMVHPDGAYASGRVRRDVFRSRCLRAKETV